MKKSKLFVFGLLLTCLSSCGIAHIGESDNGNTQNTDKDSIGYVYTEKEFTEKMKVWLNYSNADVSPIVASISETYNGLQIINGSLVINIDPNNNHYYCLIEIDYNEITNHKDYIDSDIYFQSYIKDNVFWAQGKTNRNAPYTRINNLFTLEQTEIVINEYYDQFISLLHFQGLPSGNFKYINQGQDVTSVVTSDHISIVFNGVKFLEATGVTLNINKYGYYDTLTAGDWFGNSGCQMKINAEYNQSHISESKLL